MLPLYLLKKFEPNGPKPKLFKGLLYSVSGTCISYFFWRMGTMKKMTESLTVQ